MYPPKNDRMSTKKEPFQKGKEKVFQSLCFTKHVSFLGVIHHHSGGLPSQWLTFRFFGDYPFSRKNKPFKRLEFMARTGWLNNGGHQKPSDLSGSTISTLLHDRINPKDCQVLSLGDTGFLQFFRVVSRDYGKPRLWQII